ncbi:putative Cation transporter [Candidatus Magnetomoraceae bacterium gMMP-1]
MRRQKSIILKLIHSIPGRIHFLCPALKKRQLSFNHLRDPLNSLSCLDKINISLISGSLIIYFNPEHYSLKKIFLAVIRAYPRVKIIPSSKMIYSRFNTPVQISKLKNKNSSDQILRKAGSLLQDKNFQRVILILLSIIAALILRRKFKKNYNRIMLHWLLLIGRPIINEAYQTLVKDRTFNIELLDTAAIGMSILRKNYLPTLIMILLYSISDLIKARITKYSRRKIRNLMKINGDTAWIIKHGKEMPIDVNLLKSGDKIIVHTKERVPVDGIITDGTALIDQKSLTGESIPTYKKTGELVYASTYIEEGKILIKSQKVGEQTLAANTIKIIEAALEQKVDFHHEIEKIANRLVPLTFIGAALSFFITGSMRSVMAVFMIDYGSGIRITVPIAIMISLINASKKGIFIKNGNSLEQIFKSNTVIFDKTGTLTYGLPEIKEVISYDKKFTPKIIIKLAACAEIRTTHPVARAIRNKARQWDINVPKADWFDSDIGFGLRARIEDKHIILGNKSYMNKHNIDCTLARHDINTCFKGHSFLYIAVNNYFAGVISYSDALRPESRQVIKKLKSRGIKKIFLLSGDSLKITQQISQELEIENYYAEVLPQKKAEIISDLKDKGHISIMIGDGINDGPALSLSNVGISMKESSDIARETADIVLLNNDLNGLIDLMDLSRQTMQTIKKSAATILIPSGIATILAVFGLIGPGIATLMNDGATILACMQLRKDVINE